MTQQTNTHTAQVLEEAADLLLINGRCTVVGRTITEEYCVLGAIAKVQGVSFEGGEQDIYNDEDPAIIALASHVAPQVDAAEYRPSLPMTPTAYVWCWNDLLDHDDFEIIDTLRIVAKDLRNGE